MSSGNTSEQSLPQSIPAGVLVTSPEPVPLFWTVSRLWTSQYVATGSRAGGACAAVSVRMTRPNVQPARVIGPEVVIWRLWVPPGPRVNEEGVTVRLAPGGACTETFQVEVVESVLLTVRVQPQLRMQRSSIRLARFRSLGLPPASGSAASKSAVVTLKTRPARAAGPRLSRPPPISTGSAAVPSVRVMATPVVCRADWTSAGVQPGWRSMRRAAAPAAWAAAIEVPLIT